MNIYDTWLHVEEGGYVLHEPREVLEGDRFRPASGAYLAPRNEWKDDAAPRQYDPLSVASLHLRFCRLSPTPEAFQAFANEYGLLLERPRGLVRFLVPQGPPGRGIQRMGLHVGEPVDAWVSAWAKLTAAVRALRAASETGSVAQAEERVRWGLESVTYVDDFEEITYTPDDWQWELLDRARPGEAARRVARFTAQWWCNQELREHAAPQFLVDPGDAELAPRMHIRSRSLLGAMWIHLMRGIDGRKHLGVCEHCGGVFESQRRSARYCPEKLGTWCGRYARRARRLASG